MAFLAQSSRWSGAFLPPQSAPTWSDLRLTTKLLVPPPHAVNTSVPAVTELTAARIASRNSSRVVVADPLATGGRRATDRSLFEPSPLCIERV